MQGLKSRIARMEQTRAVTDLDQMTDAELRERAKAFPMFSKEMYAVLVKLVCRRPSSLPIVQVDPERAKH
jgi:hypothetical protein